MIEMSLPIIEEIQSNAEFNVNYLVCVYDEQHVYHICVYENRPTQDEIDELIHELNTDDEFFHHEKELLASCNLAIVTADEYTELLKEIYANTIRT